MPAFHGVLRCLLFGAAGVAKAAATYKCIAKATAATLKEYPDRLLAAQLCSAGPLVGPCLVRRTFTFHVPAVP